ncbi:MAG: sulfatase-like hydrolase/transferase [Verrucomicrobiales bacterium]|nr:sulfatase-like hydrolase/transferase [Verrucomicrobiales bacterium]
MRTFFTLFLIWLCIASASTRAAERPNIILLMGDDHGWEEVGYNDHPYLHTPFLDEMAASGLRLDRFYAQPSCSPTRGSFLTGRHPNRYGIFRPGYSIRPEEITVAHLLRDGGYATAHFGKWHVGPVKESSPTNPGAMGFDEWFSHDNFFEMDPVFSRNGGPPQKYYGESSEIIIDEAINFIEAQEQGEKPFFTVIWFGSPHEPYSGLETDLALYRDLPEKYADREVSLTSNETGLRVKRPLRDVLIERYAEITAMDRSIGKLRNALRTMGLRENTLVWYCGDNGIPPSGLRESQFRGLKGTVYENGIRVPGVIEWPAGISTPVVSAVSSHTSDILPTLCDLAGVDLPERTLDGISLAPLWRGEMTERPEPIEIWNFRTSGKTAEGAPYIDPEHQKGTTPLVKQMRGLYTRNFVNFHHPKISESDFEGDRVILTDDYKLVIDGGKETGVELFDLSQDPGETQNLAESHPDVVKRLSGQLRQWQESVIRSLMGEDYP